VGFTHGLDFGTDNIERQTECSSFRGAKRFAGEIEEFASVFIFESGTGCDVSDESFFQVQTE
jgi:hypothetical protein